VTLPPCPDRRHTQVLFPSSAEEAAILASRHQAPYLAGASAAQLGWSKSTGWPAKAISLHALDDLQGCRRAVDHWSIGALARLSELTSNRALCRELPTLHGALLGVGAPGVRHLATLGGNIGFAGDLMPILLVLDTQVDWMQGAGPLHQSALSDWLSQAPEHALITRIRIPLPGPGRQLRMEKLASREAFNPPLLNIASSWQWQPFAQAHLAAGGAGLAPRRLRSCEQAFNGDATLIPTAATLLPLLARDLPEQAAQPLLPIAANLLLDQWSASRL
jgi:CO/xanthine dehydrogenase FAD-binding subunit|tara:strand:- start:45303 stop:46130 length:828 start_codon:yes stop_codon:yes gene_type:complete